MDFSLPPVGEGLYEVELIRWLVKPGDTISRGQSLMEVMSDKATMEVPSAFTGTITETQAAEGTKIKVGEVVLRYDPGEGAVAEPVRGPAAAVAAEVPVHPPVRVSNGRSAAVAEPPAVHLPAASPSVRLLARKLGVDLTRIQGTGPAGRILHEDLAGFLAPKTKAEQPKPPTKSDAAMLDLGKAGTRFRLIGLRRKIAEHMIASTRSIPHYAYIDECDLTDLVRLRTSLKEIYAKAGVKLTYLPFIVKAVARALTEVPLVNATFHEA